MHCAELRFVRVLTTSNQQLPRSDRYAGLRAQQDDRTGYCELKGDVQCFEHKAILLYSRDRTHYFSSSMIWMKIRLCGGRCSNGHLSPPGPLSMGFQQTVVVLVKHRRRMVFIRAGCRCERSVERSVIKFKRN